MRVWIDATQPESLVEIFGMTLVERQLRTVFEGDRKLRGLKVGIQKAGMDAAQRQLIRLAKSRSRPSEIWIELPPDAPEPNWLPAKFAAKLPIRWMREPGSTLERLQRALAEADGETVLALAGDTVIDRRIIDHMCWWPGGSAAFITHQGVESAAVLRLDNPLPDLSGADLSGADLSGADLSGADLSGADGSGAGESLLEIALGAIQSGAIKQVDPNDMETYIKKLRRDLPPFAFHIGDEAARATVEHFLFESNYKGSTDFMTKWAYPPLVWRLLQPLTRHRVHPNAVTFLGIAACFTAVPLFAAGMWLPGLVLAYIMSVLDSVDGKLARVTFRSSEQGDVLDHGMDIIHPPFWYWAWGWALSGGDIASGVFQASLWMSVFYIFDRVMEMLFTASTGKSIHGYTELDARMRTFISRRNVNLALFTVALPLGLAIPAFYLIVGWQAASALFHLSRVITFWNANEVRPIDVP